jgi:hypothetical protein
LVGFAVGTTLLSGQATVTEVIREMTVQTITATSTETMTLTRTRFIYIITRRTSPNNDINDFNNVNVTVTTRTITQTVLTTVYPAERGDVLVTDRGSGDKDTRPFTLETVSDLKITVRIRARADLRWVSLSWYLYNVEEGRWIKHGEVNQEEGDFEFYAARVPAGNWYIRILAANCDWEITVEKVT